MSTFTLHNGERFCIVEAERNGSTRLYIKVGEHNPVPTFTEHPSGLVPENIVVEQWESTNDQTVQLNDVTLLDGNGLELLGIIGGRPKKRKQAGS